MKELKRRVCPAVVVKREQKARWKTGQLKQAYEWTDDHRTLLDEMCLCLTIVYVRADKTVGWVIPISFYLGIKDNQYRDYLLFVKGFRENWEEKSLNEEKWEKIQ